MRGITLEEISESTKISRKRLEALENEEFDQLPGGIFNRGFVRSYARYLGLDEEQAVADYVEVSKEQPPPEDQFPLEVPEEQRRRSELNPRRSPVPVPLALVVLLLVVGGWTYWVRHRTTGGASHSAAAGSASKASSSNAAGDHSNTPLNPGVVQAAAPPKADQKPVKESPPPKVKYFKVSVKATQDSWISVVADGKTMFARTMTANQERTFKAVSRLVLTTRNAGGIEVKRNGKPLEPLGLENEPRTLSFNATGLEH